MHKIVRLIILHVMLLRQKTGHKAKIKINDLCHFFFFKLGGMAGLMVCLFARFQEWRDKRAKQREERLRQVISVVL